MVAKQNRSNMPDRSRPGSPTTAHPSGGLQGGGDKCATGTKSTPKSTIKLPTQGTTIGTWNVRTLFQCGKVKELTHELQRYRWDIVGLAEVRWTAGQPRHLLQLRLHNVDPPSEPRVTVLAPRLIVQGGGGVGRRGGLVSLYMRRSPPPPRLSTCRVSGGRGKRTMRPLHDKSHPSQRADADASGLSNDQAINRNCDALGAPYPCCPLIARQAPRVAKALQRKTAGG
ncbi:hypothetical protein C0Q70_02815 [Pomacea canaliculata]|uniref:Endonuclease/exonuclease/phosphatase domain-containing protein n=1 Tax=Pomacea canaliculata TaxID=400727 RepID=A0A2T7PQY7_POMCA|nr:hypothetical protein C0Q70_02815 [Pomacea canaliculata]